MNKKADIHLVEVLRDLIIGAIILLILLIPTIYLIKQYYGAEECQNQGSFNNLLTKLIDIENKEISESEVSFFNEDCYLVTFTQDPNYNEIIPPQNNFKSPFICLCDINNDECITDKENCIELTTFTQINDKQFTTKPLNKHIFLTIKSEDKKLLITTEKPQQNQIPTQQEKIQIESRAISDVAYALEYAKTHILDGKGCYCEDKCNDYANWLVKYSKEYSPENDPLDSLLVLSIMMGESNCKPQGCRYDKGQYSCGLMQVNKNDFIKYGEDTKDPEMQIKAGIRHLRTKYDNYGEKTLSCYNHKTKWEKAAHAYNGWTCGNLYYIKEVMSRYEQLKNIPQPLITAQK